MTAKRIATLALAIAVAFTYVPSAFAGLMHARAIIGLGIHTQYAGHYGVAHAERHQGSKYRVAHEQLGYNYTYGNAGSGHADHHGGSPFAPEDDHADEPDVNRSRRPFPPPPVPGSDGTSQLVQQTWVPDREGETVHVAWLKDSFLQVDPSDVTPSHPAICSASLTAQGGLNGTVELSATLGSDRKPVIAVRVSGVFEGVKYELVTHPNGAVSLHFREPLEWDVKGTEEGFEISLDGEIRTKENEGPSPR